MGERRFDLGAIWREARRVVEEVARAGSEDNVPMMAAAISYYLLVAIAPLALVVSLVAGTVTKTAATTGTGGSRGSAAIVGRRLDARGARGSWSSFSPSCCSARRGSSASSSWR